MPVSADPSATVPYVLKIDRDAKPPPTFHLRYLTSRESRRVDDLLKQAIERAKPEAGDGPAPEDLLDQVIAAGLARTENVKVRGEPPKPDARPSDYLSPSELWELAIAVRDEPQVQESDRKKSLSQPITPPAESAPSAASPGSAATTAA